ncbi:primosomal protein N' (replication factor Y) (superfamily II helicase) [Proteiniborus sp. DW1]|uniref:primosomal protein N' n=1 Tax=Proteiniborus sp. DW1 TaxID=1889883 RepID=UPI00092DFBBC|nr:primosomal protein N' [Proteiniborus sp. DW1]SCG83512.1 primosomal protein N' (replication factor Y) (superfamily II helicase) [Proteiniborus sp. DW1]
MTDKDFVEVVVDNTSASTDRFYTYVVPEEYKKHIEVGKKVLVPFGKGNKLVEGVIVNVINNTEIPKSRIKPIKDIFNDDPILSKNLIELSFWMKDRYLAQYSDILKSMMPSGTINKVVEIIKLVNNEEAVYEKLKSKNQLKIIEFLKKHGETELQKIREATGIININPSINTLAKNEIIQVTRKINSEVNKKYERFVKRVFSTNDTEEVINTLSKNAIKQIEIVKYLKNIESISLKDIMVETSCSLSSLKALEEKGFITIVDVEIKRDAITKEINPYKKIKLTKEQEDCIDKIYRDYLENGYNKYLLHGVTGSGKTEVYLNLIERILESGKQAIVLVPEISLTPQTVERFAGRFRNNVAVLHSRLSNGERYDEWRKIKEGEVQIVVGARSAIFAPFDKLAFIIIDEEHEASYKSSMNPKYNAIEVAEKRCEIEGATLVLGSATPSIESYYKAKQGEYKLIELPNRVNNKEMPKIEVIDMKKELDNGNKSMFSNSLYSSILENLRANKQTILFLNRRGFSTFISCRKCGYVVKCKECDISLTYHMSQNTLKCHYCGFALKPPTICPSCGSKYIKYFGTGTQRVEEEIKRLFPNARVSRMDLDTTTAKGSHEKIFEKMKKGDIDILIGTQMITKGLDFPNVTLVGIIAADLTLNIPDFKASERTFQLLTQVGGRAGRGEYDGKVILQTYEPEHYSIMTAKSHDYVNFYNKEISIRKEFNYPPFRDIINIIISGENEKDTYNVASSIARDIRLEVFKQIDSAEHKETIIGPMEAPIYRIKNKYRRQIIIKAKRSNITLITKAIDRVNKDNIEKNNAKNISVSIDFNPVSII